MIFLITLSSVYATTTFTKGTIINPNQTNAYYIFNRDVTFDFAYDTPTALITNLYNFSYTPSTNTNYSMLINITAIDNSTNNTITDFNATWRSIDHLSTNQGMVLLPIYNQTDSFNVSSSGYIDLQVLNYNGLNDYVAYLNPSTTTTTTTTISSTTSTTNEYSEISGMLGATGTGIGNFLDYTRSPLGKFIFWIVIIGALVGVISGITILIKKIAEKINM